MPAMAVSIGTLWLGESRMDTDGEDWAYNDDAKAIAIAVNARNEARNFTVELVCDTTSTLRRPTLI